MANLDRLREFTAALRSGEFPQTQKRLRDDRGYCCLGVACELFRRETGKGEWEADGRGEDGVRDFIVDGLRATGYMTTEVTNWFDMPYDSGDFKTSFKSRDEEGNELNFHVGGADMNDAGMTFEQIAEVYEYEYGLTQESL